MRASLLVLLLAAPAAAETRFYRFDDSLDAPVYDLFMRPGTERYLAVDEERALTLYLEPSGKVARPVELKPPSFMLLRDKLVIEWPMRLLGDGRSGLETVTIRWPEGAGVLRRQLYDARAFVDGAGSLDDPPLKRPVEKPCQVYPETDPAIVARLADYLRRYHPR